MAFRLPTVAGCMVACLLFSLAAPAQQALRMIELTAGFHRIEAELAVAQRERMVGLMNRKSMPTHHGMLFVFDEAARHCMWMKNTLIPLAVAFLDDGGRIINVEEMQPHSERNHCAARPARYALEMNGGWFKARGLGAGAAIGGIDSLR